MKEVSFIDTEAGLADLVGELVQHGFVALDTEFVRERTYYPKLCLLQVANDEHIACIDPLRIGDLSPLLDLIADTSVEKILHSARQDLEVIYQSTARIPTPIFDTQVAASLVGHDLQTGYAAVVEALLGVKLSKAHTRADWARRPLSREQVQYAADDVKYLVPVYHRLRDELVRLGRLEWLRQEVTHLTDRSLYVVSPQEAWKKIKGAGKFNGQELRAIEGLADWRERRAVAKNRPRQWVLKDPVILEFARALPETREELRAISGMPEFVVRECSQELLAIAERAKSDDTASSGPPRRPPRLTPREKNCLAEMMRVVAQRGSEKGIQADLLATRKELKRLLWGERELSVLDTWRYELVGKDLLTLLDSLN